MTRSKNPFSTSYTDAVQTLALPLNELESYVLPCASVEEAQDLRLTYYSWRSAFLEYIKKHKQDKQTIEAHISGPLNARLQLQKDPPALIISRDWKGAELQERIDKAVELSRQRALQEGAGAVPEQNPST